MTYDSNRYGNISSDTLPSRRRPMRRSRQASLVATNVSPLVDYVDGRDRREMHAFLIASSRETSSDNREYAPRPNG